MTPIAPLASIEGGPVLHAVLGATYHLEILEAEDVERIESANAIVKEWLGDRFGVSWLSCWHEIGAYRPNDLEYASCYPISLHAPVGADEQETIFLQNLGKLSRDEYQVTVTGSRHPGHGSPIGYEFWAEIPEVGLGDSYRVHSVLSVSVPTDWPLDDFHRRVRAIAGCLRLRWGAAGYSYSDWIPYDFRVAWEAKYAHARRYAGFDVAVYAQLCRRWHDELRTVNWLTWLGPALVDKLKRAGRVLDSSSQLHLDRCGDSICIRAGESPEAGDVNRLEIPEAYAAADRLVRPVRAKGGMDFGGLWTEETTEAWLSRFE